MAIKNAEETREKLAEEIDTLLRTFARSALIDPDPEAEARYKERAAKFKEWEALYPARAGASRQETMIRSF